VSSFDVERVGVDMDPSACGLGISIKKLNAECYVEPFM